jgi:hypothetical protein
LPFPGASAFARPKSSTFTVPSGRTMMFAGFLAFDELDHQRRGAVAVLEPVDLRDVRVIQRREHFRFALEPRQPFGITGDGRRQHLQRDLPLQVGVGRAIHLAHAAFAQQRDDVVGAKARSPDELVRQISRSSDRQIIRSDHQITTSPVHEIRNVPTYWYPSGQRSSVPGRWS